MHSLPHTFRSLPRRREPSCERRSFWVPTLVFTRMFMGGMIGLLVACSPTKDKNLSKDVIAVNRVQPPQNVTLMDSDFNERKLIKGMAMQDAMQNLEFLGWEKHDYVHVSSSGMTNLWLEEPCKAAAFDYSSTYKTVSSERPPQQLLLNATFYECVDGKPINMGQLAEVNIKEDVHAKNK